MKTRHIFPTNQGLFKEHDTRPCASQNAAGNGVAGRSKNYSKITLVMVGIVFLAMVSLVMLMPGPAFAEDETTLTAANFSELKQDVEQATGDTTILLTDNIDFDEVLPISDYHITISSENDAKTITPADGARHFEVSGAGTTLTLENITMDGLDNTTTGGGIEVTDGATLELLANTTITNCSVNEINNDGGAVSLTGSTLLMDGADINNNFATQYGGGIYATSTSTVTIESGTISDNAVEDSGGGIEVDHTSVLTMNGGEVYNNSAWDADFPRGIDDAIRGYGGGICATYDTSFFFSDGQIYGNKCSYTGGGVFVGSPEENPAAISDQSVLEMTGGTIHDNEAQYAGGGVSVRGIGTVFQMFDGTITENNAWYYPFHDYKKQDTGYGGGVYVIAGEFIMGDEQNTTYQPSITNNHADSQGGGIYAISYENYGISDIGEVNINYGSITNNDANLMGGGMVAFAATINMKDGLISENTAGSFGGGVALADYGDGHGGTMNMQGGSITNNSVTSTKVDAGLGGGVYLNVNGVGNTNTFPELVCQGGDISHNTATNNGGGIYAGKQGKVDISEDSTIEDNAATHEGGAIYSAGYTGFASGAETGDYSKVTASDYSNVITDDTVLFHGNTASAAYTPPDFAPTMTNLEYASSSISGTAGDMPLLNNYDINYISIKAASYAVIYHANGGEGTDYQVADIAVGTSHNVLNYNDNNLNYSKPDYKFAGWSTDANGKAAYQAGATVDNTVAVNGVVNLYAQWTKSTNPGGGGGGGTEPEGDGYIVYYEAGNNANNASDIPAHSKELAEGTRYTVKGDDPEPSRSGYTFEGWEVTDDDSGKLDETYDPGDIFRMPDNDVTLTAQWNKDNNNNNGDDNLLNKEDHYAYVIGYQDDTIRPNGNITRAESATIFFRLLTENARDQYWNTANAFADVQAGQWFNNSVSTMSNAGIIKGYPDGSFRPNGNITRAEYAALVARFDSGSYSNTKTFNDIDGHWAKDAILKVAARGWLEGYPDGSFRPDAYITRAEVMTLINKVLDRLPENENDLLDDMMVWKDNTNPANWYYLAVQEATNSHNYQRKDDGTYEQWTDLTATPTWEQYQ